MREREKERWRERDNERGTEGHIEGERDRERERGKYGEKVINILHRKTFQANLSKHKVLKQNERKNSSF